jgi:hypothetical protein
MTSGRHSDVSLEIRVNELKAKEIGRVEMVEGVFY